MATRRRWGRGRAGTPEPSRRRRPRSARRCADRARSGCRHLTSHRCRRRSDNRSSGSRRGAFGGSDRTTSDAAARISSVASRAGSRSAMSIRVIVSVIGCAFHVNSRYVEPARAAGTEAPRERPHITRFRTGFCRFEREDVRGSHCRTPCRHRGLRRRETARRRRTERGVQRGEPDGGPLRTDAVRGRWQTGCRRPPA